jgi:hypothetical protein
MAAAAGEVEAEALAIWFEGAELRKIGRRRDHVISACRAVSPSNSSDGEARICRRSRSALALGIGGWNTRGCVTTLRNS